MSSACGTTYSKRWTDKRQTLQPHLLFVARFPQCDKEESELKAAGEQNEAKATELRAKLNAFMTSNRAAGSIETKPGAQGGCGCGGDERSSVGGEEDVGEHTDVSRENTSR